MKLTDISNKTIQKASKVELVSLHRRVHQLYALAMRKKPTKKEFVSFLQNIHEILINEMNKRQIKHNSPLTLTISLKFLHK